MSAARNEVRRWLCLLILFAIPLLAACGGNMEDQAKCEPLEQIQGFKDGACAQPLPAGVVARDALVGQDALTTGQSGGQYVSAIPLPVTADLLQRGREQYTIFCQPCHGAAGYGDGIAVQYGFPAPPSLHDQTMRQQPPGYLFDVITHGLGRMYAYGQEIDVPDRWAVVAYVQALQISQHAPADRLPEADRERLPQ